MSRSTKKGPFVHESLMKKVDAITRSLAKELGPRKIRVNSINPGMIETEGFHAAGIAGSDFQKQVESQTPLAVGIGIHNREEIIGRMGPPKTPILSAVGDSV